LITVRLARLAATVLTVTFLSFAAMNVFGEPLVNILGNAALDPVGHADDIAEVTEKYHLDSPVVVAYGHWLAGLGTGDFGRSYVNEQSVSTILAEKLPVTLRLVVLAQLIAIIVAVPWAVLAASKEGGIRDRGSTVVSFGLIALPEFAVGVLLFYLLVVRWRWLPSRYDGGSLLAELHSLMAPALALALPLAAVYQRLLHTELALTLRSEFIAFARAKGNTTRRVLWLHALRPSSFGLVTAFGMNTGALIGGTLVVEQIFSVPGAGGAIVTAIDRDDFPTVLGFVVVISVAFVLVNWMVDTAYQLLDPRIRVS
jgi:peptide/nickel transport system permease protein